MGVWKDNNMKKEKLLRIIAVIWLVIAIIGSWYSGTFCYTEDVSGPPYPMVCEYNYTQIFLNLLAFGIPSWIIFVYLIINKMKKHNKTK